MPCGGGPGARGEGGDDDVVHKAVTEAVRRHVLPGGGGGHVGAGGAALQLAQTGAPVVRGEVQWDFPEGLEPACTAGEGFLHHE